MKQIIYIISTILLFCSCDTFLEEVSQDEIVPKSVSYYKEILIGESFPTKSNEIDWLELLTDNLDTEHGLGIFGANSFNNGFGYYTWQQEPEYTLTGTVAKNAAWDKFYKSILGCNIVISTIDNVSGSQQQKNDVLAEAHFLRAYHYLMLVNLFGEPFQKGNSDNLLGVPINDEYTIDERKYDRKSVQEVYTKINSEIQKAIYLFKKSGVPKTIFRPNLAAAYALASRIFLYQQEYEKTVLYADSCLALKPSLADLRNSSTRLFARTNPEILFSYGKYMNHVSYYNNNSKGYFIASVSLLKLFETNDGRRTRIMIDGRIQKSRSDGATVYGKAIRSAEALLNRAEAYISLATPKTEKALADINFLRSFRVKGAKKIELSSISKPEDLKTIILNERRKELCFEEHRWFDLRRLDQPSITHKIAPEEKAAKDTYVLEQADKAYTLPVPKHVIEKDYYLKQIDRPIRNKQ